MKTQTPPQRFREFRSRLFAALSMVALSLTLTGCGGKKNDATVSNRTQLGSSPHAYGNNCTNCSGYTAKITAAFAQYKSQLGDFDMGITLYAPNQYAQSVANYSGPVVIGGSVRIRSLSGCYLPPGDYEIVGSQVSGSFGWKQSPFHLQNGQAVLQSRTTNQNYTVPLQFQYLEFDEGQSFRWEVDGLVYDNRFWGQLNLCNTLQIFVGS
ncbi:MAG: hypothetical protein KDD22_04840 [Bdellovibrionales bacterium]|nr:hypothetical protein [Bdellovibrionales bacterium]